MQAPCTSEDWFKLTSALIYFFLMQVFPFWRWPFWTTPVRVALPGRSAGIQGSGRTFCLFASFLNTSYFSKRSSRRLQEPWSCKTPLWTTGLQDLCPARSSAWPPVRNQVSLTWSLSSDSWPERLVTSFMVDSNFSCKFLSSFCSPSESLLTSDMARIRGNQSRFLSWRSDASSQLVFAKWKPAPEWLSADRFLMPHRNVPQIHKLCSYFHLHLTEKFAKLPARGNKALQT